MKDLNRFMSYAEFKECHDIKVNYLSFYGLLSALKALKATFKDNLRDNTTIYEDPVNRFLSCMKPSKLAYEKLVACKQGSPTKSQGKWLTDWFGNLFCGLEDSL